MGILHRVDDMTGQNNTPPPYPGGGSTSTVDEVAREQIKEVENSMKDLESSTAELTVTAKFIAATSYSIPDKVALSMPSLFPVWPDGVNSEGVYTKGQIISDLDVLYRVETDKTKPIESQAPHDEGMLAVYRPIDISHAGTLEDPIPWIYGMNCYEGKYYSYNEKVYLCKSNMEPCVWSPDTPGLWQWEVQE